MNIEEIITNLTPAYDKEIVLAVNTPIEITKSGLCILTNTTTSRPTKLFINGKDLTPGISIGGQYITNSSGFLSTFFYVEKGDLVNCQIDNGTGILKLYPYRETTKLQGKIIKL